LQNDYKTAANEQAWLQCIARALEGLEYGSVLITVHDSQITQIERVEKQRFPLESSDSRAMSRIKAKK
jgi:hypothetical protein